MLTYTLLFLLLLLLLLYTFPSAGRCWFPPNATRCGPFNPPPFPRSVTSPLLLLPDEEEEEEEDVQDLVEAMNPFLSPPPPLPTALAVAVEEVGVPTLLTFCKGLRAATVGGRREERRAAAPSPPPPPSSFSSAAAVSFSAREGMGWTSEEEARVAAGRFLREGESRLRNKPPPPPPPPDALAGEGEGPLLLLLLLLSTPPSPPAVLAGAGEIRLQLLLLAVLVVLPPTPPLFFWGESRLMKASTTRGKGFLLGVGGGGGRWVGGRGGLGCLFLLGGGRGRGGGRGSVVTQTLDQDLLAA